jgi:hypothetical protein
VKAELLFIAAFDRVSATQATIEYLYDKAVAFAEAFEGDESHPAFPILSRLFCLGFRPGWNAEPRELIEQATRLSVRAIESLEACKANSPERLASEAEAEAAEQARIQSGIDERAAFAAKREAEAEANKQAEAAADALLAPPTLNAVLITDLGIHGLAENAYKKAGLETVGDVLTYSQARPLDDIVGISERFAKQTMEAIEAKRAEFAKTAPTAE